MGLGCYKNYEDNFEEDVFWIFVHIMRDKNWRSICKPGFPKLIEMCKYLEKQIQTQVKDVYDVLKDTEVIFNVI